MYKEIIMKLKAINIAIVALGLSLPFATIAATTESPTTAVVSEKTDLSQPDKSDSAILAWANSTGVAIYTYNFKNYRDEIQKLSGFFTDSAWTQFQTALKTSNNLDTVIAKKLIVSAAVTGAPVIVKKGLLNELYSWTVQMPMTVTYTSASDRTQQNIIVTMQITRTSSVNAPTGVAISQFVVTPATGESNSK